MHTTDAVPNANQTQDRKVAAPRRWFPKMMFLATAMLGGLFALIQTSAVAAEPAEQAPSWNLPAGPLDQVLNRFAAQSNLTISYSPDLIKGKMTRGLSGAHAPVEALRLLLIGTGLTFDTLNATTFVLRAEALSAAPSSSKNQSSQSESTSRQEAPIRFENVVVTGTQIEGVHDIASPLSIYTREDIDQTGTGSMQRFIQTLPQNFKGGASEGTGTTLAGGGTANNGVQGTGVNLRGLGNDSTLVLLNGHRIAPGNGEGNFVDISLIPVTALDRVEVMPDGASALYGSDAVGGVVNFITRKDYEGAETRLRYGAVTEGSLDEFEVAQTFGKAWNSGSALVSYDYLQQSALNLNDKSWVLNRFTGPFDILPQQKRHALFANINQSIGDTVELFGDATYAKRLMPNDWFSYSFSGNTYEQNYQANIDAWSVDGGARVVLPNSWKFETSMSYAASDTKQKTLYLGHGTVSRYDTNTGIFSWDAKLNGTLFMLPAGSVQFASGVQYQRASYKNFNLLTDLLAFEDSRDIYAGYAEARIPIMGSDSEREPKLEMDLAGRYEHYSDFGSTTNPKVGLIWRAIDDLKFRGTWGTSFRAPELSQLNPVPSQVAALLIPDPIIGKNVPAMFVFGGNPDLKPEKAKTWTAGFDWTPQSLPGLRANVTYYNIDFTNRITSPQGAFAGVANTSNPLVYENLLMRFITRNPSLTGVQKLVDNTALWSDFTGIPGGVDLSTIAALIDYRNANLSAVHTNGIDFGTSYRWQSVAADMEVGVDATYILALNNVLAPGVPAIEAVNTVFNPVHLKLRTHWAFDAGPLNGAMFVNYVNSYRDTRSNPAIPIASWTTFDANLGYHFKRSDGLLAGTSLAIGAINLFDRAPPYVAPSYSATPGYNSFDFDGANADVRGRFVYAQIIKQF